MCAQWQREWWWHARAADACAGVRAGLAGSARTFGAAGRASCRSQRWTPSAWSCRRGSRTS
eukprot:4639904-Prymnesium_polylepis.1